jgi:hypothetical protein
MTNQEIARRRLYNQHLRAAPFASPRDVVRHLAALQAQEFAYAKWSVAQRANGANKAEIDRLFAEGSILRTHVLRPTWHFVLPADIRWLLALTAPRVNALNAFVYRQCGLDGSVFSRSNALFRKGLRGGRQLTRTQLAGILRAGGIDVSGLHLAYIVMRAELDAVLCSGALNGKQQTYALLDERVPRVATLTREEALAELSRRYFMSRGPATLKDYLRWSSLPAVEGRKGLEMIKSELAHEIVDGRTYWFSPSEDIAKSASPVIDLLQGYDEYFMSYSESRDVLRKATSAKATSPQEPGFLHAILLDGQPIGNWKHVLTKNVVRIEVHLDRPLLAAEKDALELAVERYGRFLGMSATLSALT